MFLVRNVFHAKPGKAKELAALLKNASQHMPKVGVNNVKVLTDAATTFWTVVLPHLGWPAPIISGLTPQSEVEDLNAYVDMARIASKTPELGEAMKGYVDLVDTTAFVKSTGSSLRRACCQPFQIYCLLLPFLCTILDIDVF